MGSGSNGYVEQPCLLKLFLQDRGGQLPVMVGTAALAIEQQNSNAAGSSVGNGRTQNAKEQDQPEYADRSLHDPLLDTTRPRQSPPQNTVPVSAPRCSPRVACRTRCKTCRPAPPSPPRSSPPPRAGIRASPRAPGSAPSAGSRAAPAQAFPGTASIGAAPAARGSRVFRAASAAVRRHWRSPSQPPSPSESPAPAPAFLRRRWRRPVQTACRLPAAYSAEPGTPTHAPAPQPPPPRPSTARTGRPTQTSRQLIFFMTAILPHPPGR